MMKVGIMKDELDKILCEKYPKIFKDRHSSMMTTAMCWGFECGDGWYEIIDKLCDDIQKICDENDWQIKAVQVKEKFGELRFYIDRGNDAIWDLIDNATKQSRNTCEVCGKPGKVMGKIWYYCACPEHTHDGDKDELHD